jgi:NADPH:quinone reductase-like Zn-dependent oxidoreductase
MRALVFDRPGLDNLKVREVGKPRVEPHDILVRVRMAGVNQMDYFVATAARGVQPMPHIPGSEFAGTVEEVGEHVTNVSRGDRVTAYNRVFDGTCRMCVSRNEMLCRKGGIMGVVTNGGFAEYAVVPERNAFRIPDDVSWEMAASLPVAALTPYHALNEAGLRPEETLVVFGASGNTGSFAIQLGKRFGARVVGVSRKDWVKDLGADHVFDHAGAVEGVRKVTDGRMAGVVLNSLGTETWPTSLDCLGLNGRLVFFGTLTGSKIDLSLDDIYSRQARLIGTTGGTRSELMEIIDLARDLKLRVWKKFRLEEGAEALRALSARERDGRILIEI